MKVVVPIIESNESVWSFELLPTNLPLLGHNPNSSTPPAAISSPPAAAATNAISPAAALVDRDSFHFRAESEEQRKRWVNLLTARLMPEHLRNQYEKYA